VAALATVNGGPLVRLMTQFVCHPPAIALITPCFSHDFVRPKGSSKFP
jgi:hypothetical protein